jgi:hypothetical protein
MHHTAFDRLWNTAFMQEGQLEADAKMLAATLNITSPLQAVRMARLLYDAGKPLEDYCDRDLAIRQKLRLYRAALEGRLTTIDLGFCKVLLEKARTSW